MKPTLVDHSLKITILRSHTDHFRAQWSPAFLIFLIVLQISEALGVAGRFQFNGINILYCTNNCKVQWQERILYFKVAMDTKIYTNEARNIL